MLLLLVSTVLHKHISIIGNEQTLAIMTALIKVNISFVNMQANWTLQETKTTKTEGLSPFYFN